MPTKEYYERNKQDILASNKQWREQNQDKIKKYYETNKEKLNIQRREYYENNKGKILEYVKQYKEIHRDDMCSKIECDVCGKFICKTEMKKHQKRKICMKNSKTDRLIK